MTIYHLQLLRIFFFEGLLRIFLRPLIQYRLKPSIRCITQKEGLFGTIIFNYSEFFLSDYSEFFFEGLYGHIFINILRKRGARKILRKNFSEFFFRENFRNILLFFYRHLFTYFRHLLFLLQTLRKTSFSCC